MQFRSPPRLAPAPALKPQFRPGPLVAHKGKQDCMGSLTVDGHSGRGRNFPLKRAQRATRQPPFKSLTFRKMEKAEDVSGKQTCHSHCLRPDDGVS